MFQLVESVRIENGKLHHIDLHNNRLNNARKVLWGKTDFVDLEKIIQIPDTINNQRYKCRVTTDGNQSTFSITPYIQRQIKTLRIVPFDTIDYTFKTNERTLLDKAFEMRAGCDDIIIVKKGWITDAWAANLIFFDGKKWCTPSTPLLRGVQREYLLSTETIFEKKIQLSDLYCYKKVKLINALIDFERAPTINVASGIVSDY